MTLTSHILAWARPRRLLIPTLVLSFALIASTANAENRRPPPRAAGGAPPQAMPNGRPMPPGARGMPMRPMGGAGEAPVNAGALLSRTYEEKAREILERYLPQKEFQIIADVTHNGRPIPRAP